MTLFARFVATPMAALALAGCAAWAPAPTTDPAAGAPEDPYTWLEDVGGARSMEWVRSRNADSERLLTARPDYARTRDRLLDILDSPEKIPAITRIGAHVYNLWRDEAHPRGLWRRASLAEYAKTRPAWETVLDLDSLARAEHESWVWGGATCVPAATQAGVDRCMIALSRGGADAKVQREFDLGTRRFVTGGFALAEAKSSVEWVDRDTLYVETDFGPGSMTESGYPRIIKKWKRGTPLGQAQTVFEAGRKDVYVFASVDHEAGGLRRFFGKAHDFYRTEVFWLDRGKLVRIDKPDDAQVWVNGEWAFMQPRSPYTAANRTHAAGSLLAIRFDDFMRGAREFDVLFEPTPTRALLRGGLGFTRSHVLLTVQDNVAERIEEFSHGPGGWQRREVRSPFPGRVSVRPLYEKALRADPLAESYVMNYEDFLTPATLFLGRTGSDERSVLKRAPSFFDAQGMKVEQHFAASADGTRVPYFVVLPRGAALDGENPTLLYGYGGFQVSQRPWYSASFGSAWLARGGILVSANIRGGGEFGPAWHQAAIKANKQRSYDDFIAVAQDLVRRGITSPRHLGMMGGSNGGLLVGAVFTQRPDLFNAVVCQVPLLDMYRYTRLLAGASWMAEYGDPSRPDQWAYISKYSPYQNVRAGTAYPRVLFTTSTRDDRVHPAHARKMVARMAEQGHPVLYYENVEGGHGGAADNAQRAKLQALEFSYLWMQLGRPRDQAAAGGEASSAAGGR